MIARGVLTLALSLYATLGLAAQLTPFRDEGNLGVDIQGTAWPESLNKDLTSGLTNRILIRVTLLRDAQLVQQRVVEISIRYDLWDERFATTVIVDGVEAEAHSIRDSKEMLAALRHMRLPRLFAADKIGEGQSHTIATEILLNPIDRERMEMIKKWVAENSAGPADIGAHASSGGWASALFNRIFEQYASGAEFAAAWREASSSKPFTLEDLTDEGR